MAEDMRSAEKVNILVVDERPENLVALEAILEPLGETVLKASSGQEALRLALDRELAVVLLEVKMPRMDGLETARLIRERDSSRQTAIILVAAADADQELVLAGYRLGAADLVFKPLDPEFLRSKVSVLVDRHRMKQRARAYDMTRRDQVYDQDLRGLISSTADGMLVLDSCGTIRLANPAAEQLLGRSAEELLGLPFGHPIESDATSEIQVVPRLGKPITVEMRTTSIRWNGAPAVVASLRDITRHLALAQELSAAKAQLEQANADLYDTSIRDELTGLLNRRGLETELWRELARVRRYGGSLTALVIDCDRFKDINTAHGYLGGDSALKGIAARMASNTRATDILARIGGDEFLVLLPETREAEGLIVAEKLRRLVSGEPITTGSCAIEATVSIAVSSVPKTASSLEDILVLTRSALQCSKDAGRDRVVTASQASVAIPTVAEALSEGYFRVLWRPIVDLASNRVVGHEAFCEAKEEKAIDVLKIARFAKKLSVLDLHCLRLIADKCRARGSGRYHCPLFPSTLLEARAEEIAEILHGAQGVEFCLDLGEEEEEVVGDSAVLGRAAVLLRERGVQLSVRTSSFGARSLEALISLTPAFIRIDKAFLAGLREAPVKRRRLSRLLNISSTLSAKIIAEGVDDNADAELLKEVGIHYGQGSSFGGLEADHG